MLTEDQKDKYKFICNMIIIVICFIMMACSMYDKGTTYGYGLGYDDACKEFNHTNKYTTSSIKEIPKFNVNASDLIIPLK